MFANDTAYGLVVIGGTGPNTYEMDGRFAVIIDLGGDDLYRGLIGSSGSENHGSAVVIDLAGGDVYQLDQGSGGTGFAGIGILFDRTGNDVYMGNRFTQGAAFSGLGLLVDLAGNDRYTSHAFAIGFCGPLGVGAVIDIAGDDHYQCGDKYPGSLNPHEAPTAKPGDPAFQYLCYGMGSGAGVDGDSNKTDAQLLNLAGGLGYLIDLEGQDQYRSGNLAQGAGHYFGLGVALDLGGDDSRAGGRTSLGAGGHYGIGLLVDAQGTDRYTPSGPKYTVSGTYDRSVSLLLDGGTGSDTYDLTRSTGLGDAEGESWSLFIDEGGADRYSGQSGLGRGTPDSLGLFFDFAGADAYDTSSGTPTGTASGRGNGRTIRTTGSLFQDR